MAKIQYGPDNVAGDGDRVAVQAGEIRSASGREQPAPQTGQVDNVNVRAGNATVGRQEDVIEGGLSF